MIYTRPAFDRAFRKLTMPQQTSVRAAVSAFEDAFGHPHRHAGIGLRPFGRFLEFRAGLKLRILALPSEGDVFLCFVGNHDEVRAFIRRQ